MCNCDGFDPSDPCPLHGRGQHSLKRWGNDLLDAHALYYKNRLCSPSRKLLISTDLTSTPSDESQIGNLDQLFSSSKEVSAIHPQTPAVEPTSTGKLKQMMRERLQAQYERGQDSGLVKTKHAPPPTPRLEKSDGSVTKAKALAFEASKQSSRDKTLEKSSRSLREKLNKIRNGTPTTEGKKDTPVFKQPPPRHHTTYGDHPSGHKGSHRKHYSDNPLQTSQTSQHGTPRVEKIVKVEGKPAVKDVPHPSQKFEYRQKDTQSTHQMRKAADNDTSRQQAAIAHTTQRLTGNDNKRKQVVATDKSVTAGTQTGHPAVSWAKTLTTQLGSEPKCTDREAQLMQSLQRMEEQYKKVSGERDNLSRKVELISAVGQEQISVIRKLKVQQEKLQAAVSQKQAAAPSDPAPPASSRRRNEVPVPRYDLKANWKTYMNNFCELMEVNEWTESHACLRLKLALSTEARELVEDVEDLPADVSLVTLATELGKVFREEFQEGKAKNLFLERTKQSDESFKKFYLELCKLYRKAYPNKESAHNQDVADRFIMGCGNEDLSSYLWEHRTRPPLDLVELAEGKACFKQQYKLANRVAGNTGVADAGLYAYDTSKNSKKNVKVKNQPEPAKTSEDLEARETRFAKTVANTVAEEIGTRLTREFKSWRGRGRGRGRGQQYDGQSNRGRGQPHVGGPATNGQEEASKPGNGERLSKDSNPRQPPTQS